MGKNKHKWKKSKYLFSENMTEDDYLIIMKNISRDGMNVRKMLELFCDIVKKLIGDTAENCNW